MIVDSSALAEQVVADVIASAFDSSGQRCSALRLLCLQEDIADRTLTMLKGAVHELRIGRTDRLAVDIGPVITAEARDVIDQHVAAMRAAGHRVEQTALGEDSAYGTFVPPTIIEIDDIATLRREVFGPVLHVVRFRSGDLDATVRAINATGYGLTFGLHTRLDETITRVTRAIAAGNLYVNRNVIGAVVGVQPFGGRGLSGTGPKAGGPLYLHRLVADPVGREDRSELIDNPTLNAYLRWLKEGGDWLAFEAVTESAASTRLGREIELPGPVGERNLYALHPRGDVALSARTATGLRIQIGAVLATGNTAIVAAHTAGVLAGLPAIVASRVHHSPDPMRHQGVAAALVEGDEDDTAAVLRLLAERVGAIVTLQSASSEAVTSGRAYRLDGLLEEVSTSINTTAAGGNATLMALV